MKKYLKVDQIIYFPQGLPTEIVHEFIDEFIKLVEKYDAQTGGGFQPMTEAEVEKDLD